MKTSPATTLASPRIAATLALAAALALVPTSAALGDAAPPAAPPGSVSTQDKAVADKLARCAANYTFQVRLLKVAGGKTGTLESSMDWHWNHAIAASDEGYTKERFEAHYRSYMAFDQEFAKIDTKKEPERAKAELARIFAKLNADSDDCELLKKASVDADNAALEKQCTENVATACASLALVYAKGELVAKDAARAATLYGKACDGGRTAACNNLGVLYVTGDGVAKDATRAAALYEKACQGGNARGCSNLAALYKNGQGVAPDAERAATLFKKACDGGYAAACKTAKSATEEPAPPPPG